MGEIKRIAVFTSGGDAPGMNAAIRSVVRTASGRDLHVYGIRNGYQGMIEGKIKRLDVRDVANILHRGGTILRTARSKDFMTAEGRKLAYENLKAHNIDACVAIGGNGTFTGAKVFSEEYDIPFVGLPGTIDNDIYGTDYSIGFDTAVNTAVEAMDKIRDTADSHKRVFFIEVMGRHSGYIGLYSGIASGAEAMFLPESYASVDDLISKLKSSKAKKKLFSLVVVAEGDEGGGAQAIMNAVKEKTDEFDMRATIIGHLQRGGSPSAFDRVLAARLGHAAVEALIDGQSNVALGLKKNKTSFTTFADAIEKDNPLDKELFNMSTILSL